MATSQQRSYNELCCLVSFYFKYTSLVHVDLGDSKLLTIVEVQQEVQQLDAIICDRSFNLTAALGQHIFFCVIHMYPAIR